jgi:hypothetical protein
MTDTGATAMSRAVRVCGVLVTAPERCPLATHIFPMQGKMLGRGDLFQFVRVPNVGCGTAGNASVVVVEPAASTRLFATTGHGFVLAVVRNAFRGRCALSLRTTDRDNG